jgi:uncharacterized protein YcfJ
VRQTLLIPFPFAIFLAACASPDAGTRALTGAAAGAAVGAAAGAALGDPLGGAGVGAAAGGAVGAALPRTMFEGRQYYRDTHGYCYFVERRGEPHYASKVHCRR